MCSYDFTQEKKSTVRFIVSGCWEYVHALGNKCPPKGETSKPDKEGEWERDKRMKKEEVQI